MTIMRTVLLALTLTAIFTDTVKSFRIGFYKETCPSLEEAIQSSVSALTLIDPTTPAALLRLLFHDCQVQGCDASIMLETRGPFIKSELLSDKNFGIRRRDAIDEIKAAVEQLCPRTVSCADIIALAARDAVVISGGPTVQIPLGRRDSANASNALADVSLPKAMATVDAMLEMFVRGMAMSVDESVALLGGGHTIGAGHCVSIVDRLYGPTADSKLAGGLYGGLLRLACPSPVIFSNLTLIPNDVSSLRFDNKYFRGLLRGEGLFHVDSQLSIDDRTAACVERFAADVEDFFVEFSSAFVKLSSHGVLTEDHGLVRSDCHFV